MLSALEHFWWNKAIFKILYYYYKTRVRQKHIHHFIYGNFLPIN